ALSEFDFGYVRRLVHERAAIVLEPTKMYLVESRLQPLAQQEGFASLTELLARLRVEPLGGLHRRVVEAMAPKGKRFLRALGVHWYVKDEIRALVEFRELNLVEEWPTMPPIDLILLRNVLIYFDVESRKRILAKVRRVLRPEGYLLLGSAETTLTLDENFDR